MQVDKDRFQKVVETVEADAISSSTSLYSFDRFCREHNLYSSVDKTRADEVMIRCPFHGDQNPSLSINEGRRIWNCLGCGRGGSYLNFVLEYDKTVLGSDLTIYDVANRILHSDPGMAAKLGFETIFIREHDISRFEKLEHVRFRFKRVPVRTYLELASRMVREGCGMEQIKYVILAMQSGMPVDAVSREVLSGDDSGLAVSKQYDLEKMEKGEC